MKTPIRYKIVKLLINNPDGMAPEAVFEAIRDYYSGERTCTLKEIDKQLMSLKAPGLAEVACAEESSNGGLVITYRITEYGKELAKQYI